MGDTVTCYIEKDNKWLMLYRNKKKNDINENKWIGVGGHIEINETPDEALIREVKEETNLDIISYKLLGIIYFRFKNVREKMYVYLTKDFKGELSDCNEGTLEYIDKNDVLSLNLWDGDRIFIKDIFNDRYFEYIMEYNDDYTIGKVEKLV